MSDTIVVDGVVEHGDHRGRQLGFPTANLRDPQPVKIDGVYAGIVQLPGTRRPTRHVAVISVGRRPTYYGGAGVRLLEAHLLDWTGDLYGMQIRVELYVRLRPQRRFESPVELIDHIHRCHRDRRVGTGRGTDRGVACRRIPGPRATAVRALGAPARWRLAWADHSRTPPP